MKKMMFLAMMMVMTISASAMNYNTAKKEALFLSDKMAYELKLSASQYDDVYEINLDYLMSVNGRNDITGKWWNRRNDDMRYVLTTSQYNKYLKLDYFYRPVAWRFGKLSFVIYNHYRNDRFYNSHPNGYITYKGGNNKKTTNYYADRGHNRHSSNNSSGWRITNSSSNSKNSGSTNHQMAHNNSNGTHNHGINGRSGGRR